MSQTFHLLVAVPDKDPVSYPVSGDKITLGRSPDNDIQILVREVSIKHCEFHLNGSGYEITDVGSTNGTKVNNQSVKEGKVQLNDHDVLLLGETIPSYFVKAVEGEVIDIKGLIGQIESDVEKMKPAVKKLVPPSAVKKVGLPTKKPPISVPLKPTMAQGSESGSSTVKLAPTVAKKLSPPSLAKQATPGAPPATPGVPPATKLAPPGEPPATPLATKLPTPGAPPVTKLAPPGGPPATPPATKLPTPGAPPLTKLAPPGGPPATPPATQLPTPGAPPPAAPAAKLATPGGNGGPAKKLSIQPDGEPAKKLAVPGQSAEGGPPKLDLPEKKTAPKLNLPPKTDD